MTRIERELWDRIFSDSLILPLYTSDAFPLSAAPSSADSGALLHPSRETVVLYLFIALEMHDDVWVDETVLGWPGEFCEIFYLMQPRACLENLLHAYLAPARTTSP
ncbi:hypothetical protein EI94DRAFT_1742121 [Lactarius quietus]|nr:hypothetical protein EI94DRAFT_1742121 [Lactarius quietus]